MQKTGNTLRRDCVGLLAIVAAGIVAAGPKRAMAGPCYGWEPCAKECPTAVCNPECPQYNPCNVSCQGPFYSTGSPNSGPTTGGEVLTFIGFGIPANIQLYVLVNGQQIPIPPDDVYVYPGGGLMTVIMPAISPGCNCGPGYIAAWIRATNCANVNIQFTYWVVVVPITDPNGIQPALNAAIPGQCLLLADNVNFNGPIVIDETIAPLITLTGQHEDDPGVTQISGTYRPSQPATEPTITFDGSDSTICVSAVDILLGNSGVEFKNEAASTVKDCQIGNNYATGERGGGVTINSGAHPRIEDCYVSVNQAAGDGAGIRLEGAGGTIRGTYILNNESTSTHNGGGIYLEDSASDTLIEECYLWSNYYGSVRPANGGGIYWTGTNAADPSRGSIRNCDIRDNYASGQGGGMYVGRHVLPDELSGNTFASNQAGGRGGGMYVQGYNRNVFPVSQNVFAWNSAYEGGALAIHQKAEFEVEYNIIYCNEATIKAPGLLIDDASPRVVHNTIFGNLAGGADSGGAIHMIASSSGTPHMWDNLMQDNRRLDPPLSQSQWEIYSDIRVSRPEQIDYNLFVGVSWQEAFSPLIESYGPNNVVASPPQLENPYCESEQPWTDFCPGDMSAAWLAASDGTHIGACQAAQGSPMSAQRAVEPSTSDDLVTETPSDALVIDDESTVPDTAAEAADPDAAEATDDPDQRLLAVPSPMCGLGFSYTMLITALLAALLLLCGRRGTSN